MSSFIERPRYLCPLGGAMMAATALPATIPIIHAAPGCAGNIIWAQNGGSGLQLGGYCGGLSVPSSNVQEREVVFGGGERLREEIRNTLDVIDGKLFFVLTGCVTEVIGDDVRAVVSPAFVVGSSLDRELALSLGAPHLSVSFPVANRAVLDRGYTGYRGGLRLVEDLVSAAIAGR